MVVLPKLDPGVYLSTKIWATVAEALELRSTNYRNFKYYHMTPAGVIECPIFNGIDMQYHIFCNLYLLCDASICVMNSWKPHGVCLLDEEQVFSIKRLHLPYSLPNVTMFYICFIQCRGVVMRRRKMKMILLVKRVSRSTRRAQNLQEKGLHLPRQLAVNIHWLVKRKWNHGS